MTNDQKQGFPAILLIAIFVLGVGSVYFITSKWDLLTKIFVYIPVGLALAVFAYLVSYYMAKKKEFKLVYTTRYEQLEKIAEAQCPDELKGYELRLSGDKDHAGIRLGTMNKYIRIKDEKYLNADRLKDLGYKTGERIEHIDNFWIYSKDDKTKIPNKMFLNIIWFSTGSKLAESIPLIKLFTKYKPACFYDYDVLGSLNGNVVLKGVSLVPIGKFNFINNYEFSMQEAHRIVEDGIFIQLAQDTLENMDKLIDKAMGADSSFEKFQRSKDIVFKSDSSG